MRTVISSEDSTHHHQVVVTSLKGLAHHVLQQNSCAELVHKSADPSIVLSGEYGESSVWSLLVLGQPMNQAYIQCV